MNQIRIFNRVKQQYLGEIHSSPTKLPRKAEQGVALPDLDILNKNAILRCRFLSDDMLRYVECVLLPPNRDCHDDYERDDG